MTKAIQPTEFPLQATDPRRQRQSSREQSVKEHSACFVFIALLKDVDKRHYRQRPFGRSAHLIN
jgi:hypothetical protein